MHVNLRLAQRLDAEGGGLGALARRVLRGEVSQAEAEELLGGTGVLLSDVLAEMLEKLNALRALTAERRADVESVRRFFMGVMRWPPRVVMEEASLGDLASAYAGFRAWHGMEAGVSARFMDEMMQKFPDEDMEDGGE